MCTRASPGSLAASVGKSGSWSRSIVRRRSMTTDDNPVKRIDYLFDTAGLAKVKASILRRNQVTRDYLGRLGWQVEPVREPPVRSHADGSLLELDLVSYTREAYRDFRATALGQRILRRLKS